MNAIEKIGYIDRSTITGIKQPAIPDKEENNAFGNMVKNAIQDVNTLHQKADLAVGKLSRGESRDIHGTMIALEKASISFELLMQVRNKVISAYDEIKRMSI